MVGLVSRGACARLLCMKRGVEHTDLQHPRQSLRGDLDPPKIERLVQWRQRSKLGQTRHDGWSSWVGPRKSRPPCTMRCPTTTPSVHRRVRIEGGPCHSVHPLQHRLMQIKAMSVPAPSRWAAGTPPGAIQMLQAVDQWLTGICCAGSRSATGAPRPAPPMGLLSVGLARRRTPQSSANE